MQKKDLFRQQKVVRAFAFAFGASAILAGCSTLGTTSAPTQSQIETACADTNGVLMIAEAFSDKLTLQQNAILDSVGDIVADQCSPSAIAADTTPQAVQSVLAELAAGLIQAQSVKVTQSAPVPAQ